MQSLCSHFKTSSQCFQVLFPKFPVAMPALRSVLWHFKPVRVLLSATWAMHMLGNALKGTETQKSYQKKLWVLSAASSSKFYLLLLAALWNLLCAYIVPYSPKNRVYAQILNFRHFIVLLLLNFPLKYPAALLQKVEL